MRNIHGNGGYGGYGWIWMDMEDLRLRQTIETIEHSQFECESHLVRMEKKPGSWWIRQLTPALERNVTHVPKISEQTCKTYKTDLWSIFEVLVYRSLSPWWFFGYLEAVASLGKWKPPDNDEATIRSINCPFSPFGKLNCPIISSHLKSFQPPFFWWMFDDLRWSEIGRENSPCGWSFGQGEAITVGGQFGLTRQDQVVKSSIYIYI